jgi:cytochrome P450
VPVEVAGVSIPAGALVMVSFAAANRDPDHFAHPDRFDVARNPQDHLGLGRGIHYCLGASLARLEARILGEVLLDRGTPLRAAEGAERLTNAVLRGFRRFPVRLANSDG